MATNAKRRCVLLVEDDPGDVKLTQIAFEELDTPVSVVIAQDGEAAMDYLLRSVDEAQGAPGLVLLDINLPRKTGYQVLSEIRAHPKLRTLPVVMMSTSSGVQDVLAAYRASANSYVTKPDSIDELFRTIKTLTEYWFETVTVPRELRT